MSNESQFKIEAHVPVVGGTYPFYGMITKVLDETLGAVVIEINNNVILTTKIDDPVKIELLKQRAFEPGIFISRVTDIQDKIVYADCSTVVFGHKQSYDT